MFHHDAASSRLCAVKRYSRPYSMGTMPKKNSLTLRRVLSLLLTYVMLCLGGGVVVAALFAPGVFLANETTKAVVPSLKVEGVDFDVTSLPQKSVMYASDGTTKIAEFYADNRTVVPLKKISKPMRQAVVAREDRRFFQHHGVDVQGVMRAFVQTFIKKGSMPGRFLAHPAVREERAVHAGARKRRFHRPIPCLRADHRA